MGTILVCVDFSDVTQRVMDEAQAMAKTMGDQVRLIHVIPFEADYVMYSPGTALPGAVVAQDRKVETERLQKLTTQLTEAGVSASCELLEGGVVSDILEEAERVKARRIVMGSHGHSSLYELVLGSVTEAVMRRAKVPVLIVPSKK